MPTQVAHFWAGTFANRPLFDDFFAEQHTASTGHSQPISKFAASQHITWLNHDLLESGYEVEGASLREKFQAYSYAQSWMDELDRRTQATGLARVDALIMCFLDGAYNPIPAPKDIHLAGIAMDYLGKIEFGYEHPDWFQAILDSKGQASPD